MAGMKGKKARERALPVAGAQGELSSASGLLHGMSLRGGKFPGHRVVREVRKGHGDQRVVHFYGGERRKYSRQEIAELARDRGFDLSFRRFQAAGPEEREKMLKGSLRWQGASKKRVLTRLKSKLAKVTNPEKRKRVMAEIAKMRRAPVRSPLTGERPISSHHRRFWA